MNPVQTVLPAWGLLGLLCLGVLVVIGVVGLVIRLFSSSNRKE